ncbi:TraB/GumN family protein [Porphyrobacter sp. TH134]|uniref:TraB/GumN family protein n=1 Tax=Porphyrobacter sp. TH134 TaxID=2067450 RepID=UPI000C7D5782|nr:TraB/GumN family protein [Porphyrobacter sp. TH134]PLK23558.1 TraB/GumN family protein [Porphyrobacter sp. TH134]
MRGWLRARAMRFAALSMAPLALALGGCSDTGGEAAAGPPPDPLFYEIANADGTVEGWMLGTIHALPDGARWRTAEIGRVIDTADFLVVEIGELNGRGEGPSIYANLAQSPGLPPLDTRLPPELRPQLAALLERGGLEPDDFSTEESWAAAIALARIDATGDPANGADRALIADFADRPVRELEGLRGQLLIFDRLPESAQRSMLAAVVRESERGRRDPARLQRAWLAGDAATIEASTREGFLADPILREALLVGRNRRWTAALVPVLQQPARPLIAVGAAHLVGPDGLAAMLAAEGFTVRRLP